MAKTCAICGKPSGMYPLCPACFKLRDAGEIEKCEECGIWHRIDEPCNCEDDYEENIINQEDDEISGQCLLCENDAGEYLFCKSCYRKYKNKTLLLKITNCEEFELLDESYEGLYVCKDGHVVKSKSERDIDNYLFEHEITHAYEKAITIGEDTFHPDFCLFLKGQKVYLEHWGYDETNAEYTRQKKYKLEKYQQAGITLICTYEKQDAKDIEAALDKKLASFAFGKINFIIE